MTNNLHRKMYEHKNHLIKGFTKRYNLTQLVYYEATNDIHSAISREKQIKGWVRRRKIALVESANPEWPCRSGSGNLNRGISGIAA